MVVVPTLGHNPQAGGRRENASIWGVSDQPGEHARKAGADFPALAARLRTVAGVLAVAALLAIVIDGAVRGLSFSVMILWLSVFVAGLVIATAISVALHALRGADAAQRRGERLAGDDVGFLPRRRPQD